MFLKSSRSLDLPCGPLSSELATVVRDELILVKREFVEPNIAFAVRPAAATEFLYLASAPGAAESTRDVTKLPSWSGAVGGGVRLPVKGLGLLPRPYDAGHFGLYSNDGEKADVLRSKESLRPVDVVLSPRPAQRHKCGGCCVWNFQGPKFYRIFFKLIFACKVITIHISTPQKTL